MSVWFIHLHVWFHPRLKEDKSSKFNKLCCKQKFPCRHKQCAHEYNKCFVCKTNGRQRYLRMCKRWRKGKVIRISYSIKKNSWDFICARIQWNFGNIPSRLPDSMLFSGFNIFIFRRQQIKYLFFRTFHNIRFVNFTSILLYTRDITTTL